VIYFEYRWRRTLQNWRLPPERRKSMPASKAQQRATNKYIAKAYDRINLTVTKGKRDIIQAHAEAHGESVNGFINRAIDQTMFRDDSKAGTAALTGGAVSVYPESEKAAPAASDGSVEGSAEKETDNGA